MFRSANIRIQELLKGNRHFIRDIFPEHCACNTCFSVVVSRELSFSWQIAGNFKWPRSFKAKKHRQGCNPGHSNEWNERMELPKTRLFYREGGSDKVYEAWIEPLDGGFVVNFAFGRRGSALKAGTKTSAPVSLQEAQKIHDGLILEKTRKGYSPGESGVAFAGTELAGRASGITCQLLTPAPAPIEDYVRSADWCGMEKFDGERRLIRIGSEGQEVIGINRRGLTVPLPEPLVAEAARLAQNLPLGTSIVLDGELLGEMLVAFDVAVGETADGQSIKDLPFRERYCLLETAFAQLGTSTGSIRLAPARFDAAGKAELVEAVRAQNGEGVVFKNAGAPYRQGRSDDALKVKFIETASVIAGPPRGGKRSVSMFVLDSAGNRVECGNVTISTNFEIPVENTVIEVAYLYAYRESGKLYQPIYKGPREDITIEECLQAQFKFRASAE